MTARYALYLTPPNGHPLYELGQHLIGRDADYGGPLAQPALDGIEPAWLAAITETPRRYGFHATLKPPFRLAEGASAEELHATAERFAAGQNPFSVRTLEVSLLDQFNALSPTARCEALHALADDCVSEFDRFRAPAAEDELARRRTNGLTPPQEEMLTRWGYPYVFDKFRPHFSLTERIEDEVARDDLLRAIRALLPERTLKQIRFDSLCLFGQPAAWMPFY